MADLGFVRRYGLGTVLLGIGLALVLAGTGVSLGYQALTQDTTAPAATEASALAPGGLQLDATLGIDTPLDSPLDPVTFHGAPGVTRSLPLPGVRVDRELGIDRNGYAVDLELGVLAGDEVVATRTADAGLSAASQKATAIPVSMPAAVAAAAAFTLAGFIAYFWTPLKTWIARIALFPLVGLYAKITRAEVFDNGVRERIFHAIRQNPGVSASDLARLADVSWGTTIYHLDVLEQTCMVTSLRKGRYRRYFENGAELTASKDAVAILRNPVTAGVVHTLRNAPGCTQKELAAATSMTPQALHWHLTRLVGAGLVRKEREGRVVRHFVGSNSSSW